VSHIQPKLPKTVTHNKIISNHSFSKGSSKKRLFSFSPEKNETGKTSETIEQGDEQNSYKIIAKKVKRVSHVKNDTLFKNKIIIDSLGNSQIENNNEEPICLTENSLPVSRLSKLGIDECKRSEQTSVKSLKSDYKVNKESTSNTEKIVFKSVENRKILKSDLESKREGLMIVYNIFINSLINNKEKICEDLFQIINCFMYCFEELKSYNQNFSKIIEFLKLTLECGDHTDKNFLRKENHCLKVESNKIKMELEHLNKQLIKNDCLNKKYIEKISSMEEILKRKDELIQNFSDKNKSIIENMEKLNNQYEIDIHGLRQSLATNEEEINVFKEKEKKLMRLIYLVYRKGKNINDLLNTKEGKDCVNNDDSEINQNDYFNDISSKNDVSKVTFYFTDIPKNDEKINRNLNIPVLDFSKLPEYESPRSTIDEYEQKQSNLKVNKMIAFESLFNDYDERKETENICDKNIKKHELLPSENINDKLYNEKSIGNRRANTIVNSYLKNVGSSEVPKLEFKNLEKTKNFQQEFLENFHKFSESWRNEVKQMKSLSSDLCLIEKNKEEKK
jgi:hypothetical protein